MAKETKKKGYSFGTFKGVYTPSVLTIFGVVMYLRFGWVLGNVGLPSTLLIVTIATSITFFTGLSISAMATNMKVGTGGAYYIISRSLGLEAGVAIGLPLFFARAFGVAFYIAGFSEALLAVVNPLPMLDPAITAKIISASTLVGLTALAYISADLALKAQFIIFAAIGASLVSLFLGNPGAELLMIEPGTLVPMKLGFWAVFAVFFPAVTGIEAGLGLSGDLKNPAKSLPLGTLAAVATGYIVYMALPAYIASKVHSSDILLTDLNIMTSIARWGSLIVVGVFAASLSSALGSLLGAPRMLQALANDRVLPRFIGRGYGKDKADPRIATAISFAVALAAVLLGDLNMIAPILSMFFLLSYGLLNLSAGLEGLIESPSWRPKFKVHYGISLLGAAACFTVMLMIDAGATLIAIFVTSLVYYLVKRRQLNAHWGDMRYGILTLLVRFAIQRLSRLKPDERTWQPNILALSGSPQSRWHLVEMAYSLAQHGSALTVASILPVEEWSAEKVKSTEATMREYLNKREVDAMVKIFPCPDMLTGAKALVRAYGYGPLTPNTILMGDTENKSDFNDFSELIQLVYRTNRNLILLRESLLDGSEESETIDVWWGGNPDNIGLILTLACQIQKSPVWKESKLVIKTIAATEEEREATQTRLETFIEEQRIPATAEVLIKDGSGFFDIIHASSAGAGLVFMGMRPPKDDESVEDYGHYYGSLMESTKDMPPLALVLAAENIEFRRVIGISQMN
ncbi:MAG: amino acid permease [Kiritimatiellales bacterium]|nr:amino acid permease [Kiritimatiellales bacterium]MCF7864595.1 amino acid permease [Kiritimatiellales bacterium]